MHVHHSTSKARKRQGILHTPLYIVDQREGVPRGAGLGREAHTVIQLVTDQRLRAAPEYGDEELVAIDAWRHRAVVLVDHLDDHVIFHEVHSPVVVALGGQAATFGGRVLVEEPITPGLYDAPPCFLRQHLGAGEYGMWPDLETSRELFIGQDACH